MSINIKTIVKGKNHYFEYKTGAFVKLKTDNNSIETPKSNTVKLEMKMVKELLPEIKYYLTQGSNEIEIRKNEIHLRSEYYNHVTSVMSNLQFDYEDSSNLETFENDKLMSDKIDKLEVFCKDKFFIPFKTDLFETNLNKSNEVVLKFVNKTDKDKHGKFLVQVTKTQVDGKKIMYIHKMNKSTLKQLRKILK